MQELDQRFSEMAEAFNQQLEHYETMVRRIKNVRQIYGCNRNDTLALAECVAKIREEHGDVYFEPLKALKAFEGAFGLADVASFRSSPL